MGQFRFRSVGLRRLLRCRRGARGGCGFFGLLRFARALPDFPLRIIGKALDITQAVETKHHGGDAIEHVAIVRHQNQGPAKFEQVFFQNFESRNIEIVGRFVEQQHVRRLQHQLRDQHPGALATGKLPHRTIQIFVGEKKPRGPGRHVNHAILISDRVAVRSQGPAQRYIRIQLAVLVEIYNFQRIGFGDFSGRRLDVAAEQAQQRGFAAAVGAHQADAHLGLHDEI